MHHVLVIDDQDLITNLIEQVLTRFGYRVTIASRGHEGTRLYDKGAFDLVITDLIMPDTDGGAVVRHVRNSSRPHTPVIGMSGTPWLLRQAEFDLVLAKPFSLKDLLHAIHSLLPKSPMASPEPSYTRALNV